MVTVNKIHLWKFYCALSRACVWVNSLSFEEDLGNQALMQWCGFVCRWGWAAQPSPGHKHRLGGSDGAAQQLLPQLQRWALLPVADEREEYKSVFCSLMFSGGCVLVSGFLLLFVFISTVAVGRPVLFRVEEQPVPPYLKLPPQVVLARYVDETMSLWDSFFPKHFLCFPFAMFLFSQLSFFLTGPLDDLFFNTCLSTFSFCPFLLQDSGLKQSSKSKFSIM